MGVSNVSMQFGLFPEDNWPESTIINLNYWSAVIIVSQRNEDNGVKAWFSLATDYKQQLKHKFRHDSAYANVKTGPT